MSFKVNKRTLIEITSKSRRPTVSLLTVSVLKKAMVMALVTGLASGSALAEIYKITKADGSVVYSDRPDQNKQSQVEVMQIPSSNTVATNSSNSRSQSNANRPNRNGNNSSNVNSDSSYRNNSHRKNSHKDQVNYTIQITSPSEERAYRKPVQNVEVAATVSPQLRAGDSVVILVDGAEVATGVSASIPTASLNPGEHTLEVKIESANGANSSATSMKFYVIQNTIAMQQKRQLAEQMLAYDALPWYQKIIAKIKPKN